MTNFCVARFVFLGPKAPINPTAEDYSEKKEDIIFLGSLYKWPESSAYLNHIDDNFPEEGYHILENYDVPADVLKDLLLGIDEELAELGKDFDYDTYTKYWVNSFRFIRLE